MNEDIKWNVYGVISWIIIELSVDISRVIILNWRGVWVTVTVTVTVSIWRKLSIGIFMGLSARILMGLSGNVFIGY